MAEAARRHARYEDLLSLPPHQVGEILAGEMHVSPRPAVPHSVASSALGAELGGPFQRGRGGPGGWWLLDEPELHFGADVLVPDLAGWRRERMPAPPRTAAIELAPDWVCEMLSPSTARLDRSLKLPRYAAVGVRWAWLIDPDAKTLEVMRNEAGRWVLASAHGNADRVRAEPFDAIELELAALWGEG